MLKLLQEFKHSLSGLNRRNPNIIVFICYGLLYDTVLNVYKPFALKFLERIGGTEFHMALYNSLPGLIGAAVLLPGTILISRLREKKRITSIFFLISRTMILLLAFVPFLPVQLQPILFILFLATMNLPEAVAQTSLQGFLGSVFEPRQRAQAITLRNKFGSVAVPAITLVSGLIIGILPRNDAERIVYYQVFYVMAFIIGLFEVKTFRKFKEEPLKELPPPVDLKVLKQIFKEPKYKRFLLTTLIFQFTWQAGWPLTSIYQIKTLGADEIWLAAFAVASGVVSFFSAGFWNKLIQKKGNSKTLLIAAFCMSFNMLFFALAPSLFVMLLAMAFTGFAVIGLTSSMLNGLLGATPDNNRLVALGAYNTLVNISLFVSPFVSNFILEQTGVVWAMIIVAAMRLVASLLLLGEFLVSRRRLLGSQ